LPVLIISKEVIKAGFFIGMVNYGQNSPQG